MSKVQKITTTRRLDGILVALASAAGVRAGRK